MHTRYENQKKSIYLQAHITRSFIKYNISLISDNLKT
jgi:hypothetical protein